MVNTSYNDVHSIRILGLHFEWVSWCDRGEPDGASGQREGVDAFYLGDGYLRIHIPLHIMSSGAIWVYNIVQ